MKIERITSNDSFCCSRKCKYSYTLLNMNITMSFQTIQRLCNCKKKLLFCEYVRYYVNRYYLFYDLWLYTRLKENRNVMLSDIYFFPRWYSNSVNMINIQYFKKNYWCLREIRSLFIKWNWKFNGSKMSFVLRFMIKLHLWLS